MDKVSHEPIDMPPKKGRSMYGPMVTTDPYASLNEAILKFNGGVKSVTIETVEDATEYIRQLNLFVKSLDDLKKVYQWFT